jgi:hypothetical protein
MCASTRSTEGVRFDRGFIEAMAKLGNNWGEVLPEAKDFMEKEAKRAEDIKLVDCKEEVTDFFNGLMKKGTSNVLNVTLKYFFRPGLRPGWCILQVVDPYVGPRAATAILIALIKLGLIELERYLRSDNASIDNEDNDHDTGMKRDGNDDGSEQLNEINDWTVDSSTHAAPTVTMDKYEKLIIAGFINAPLISVQGLVDALGLSH